MYFNEDDTYIVMREKETGRICRVFFFDLDAGKGFDYHARTSINAFFNYKKSRNENKDYTFSKYLGFEMEWMDKWADFNSALFTHLESLFEFYRIIGYDYKTHKYKELKRK